MWRQRFDKRSLTELFATERRFSDCSYSIVVFSKVRSWLNPLLGEWSSRLYFFLSLPGWWPSQTRNRFWNLASRDSWDRPDRVFSRKEWPSSTALPAFAASSKTSALNCWRKWKVETFDPVSETPLGTSFATRTAHLNPTRATVKSSRRTRRWQLNFDYCDTRVFRIVRWLVIISLDFDIVLIKLWQAFWFSKCLVRLIEPSVYLLKSYPFKAIIFSTNIMTPFALRVLRSQPRFSLGLTSA